MENLRLFHKLNNEIKNLESELESKNKKLNGLLLKDILVATNPMFEEAVTQWVLTNPIEAISYYLSILYSRDNIFYKNNDKHIELFRNYNYDEHNCYALINRKTLDITSINTCDIVNLYSNQGCGNEVFIELDFLNNFKIPLIKEVGNCIHDNSWAIEYDCIKQELLSTAIYNIIYENFIINEYYSTPEEFEISKKNINKLLLEHKSKLDVYFDSNKTFAIYKLSNIPEVIGFIEISFYKNFLHEYEIEIGNFRIFENYKEMNYEPKILDMIEETYSTEIGEMKEPIE